MPTLWVYNSTPNVNAQSNYPLILGVSFPLLLLMLATVGTRLYVRVRTVRGIGADDWTIVVAALCSIAYVTCTIAQSRWGLGLPLTVRPKVNLDTYSAINYAGRPFYMLGILGFKVSLCFSYLRILSMGQPYYRLLVQKAWRPKTPGTCFSVGPLFYSLAIISVVFDVIIFFLPIPFVYRLQMDKQKKYGIIATFALGIFTTVCSVMRSEQIPVVAFGSGNSTMLVLWGNVELNIGIILTCLPVVAPLFKVFSRKLTSSGNRSGSNAYPHNGSHNMQVFTNNQSHHRATISNSNARGARASMYPEDVSDSDSQETILGKAQESNTDNASGSVGRSLDSSMSCRNNDGNRNGKRECDGIMRTVQVDVSSEERGIGFDDDFAPVNGGKR
ncbi:hypothetical protein NHQ30_004170 [Ciborinia camelliae]|nr:hypothetical protein NHQ30_004170 [Ciborinia camelliae]